MSAGWVSVIFSSYYRFAVCLDSVIPWTPAEILDSSAALRHYRKACDLFNILYHLYKNAATSVISFVILQRNTCDTISRGTHCIITLLKTFMFRPTYIYYYTRAVRVKRSVILCDNINVSWKVQ